MSLDRSLPTGNDCSNSDVNTREKDGLFPLLPFSLILSPFKDTNTWKLMSLMFSRLQIFHRGELFSRSEISCLLEQGKLAADPTAAYGKFNTWVGLASLLRLYDSGHEPSLNLAVDLCCISHSLVSKDCSSCSVVLLIVISFVFV